MPFRIQQILQGLLLLLFKESIRSSHSSNSLKGRTLPRIWGGSFSPYILAVLSQVSFATKVFCILVLTIHLSREYTAE